MSARVNECRCGHSKQAHKYESGFYDVRGHFAECDHIGCPCRRFEGKS